MELETTKHLTLLLSLAALLAAPGTGIAAGVEVTTQAAAEGTYGLAVNFGPDCASPHTLELDGGDGPLTGPYEACRTIEVESVSIASGGAVLTAGDRISLSNGVSVPSNASLVAAIDNSLTGGPTYVEDESPIEEEFYSSRFSARFDDLVLAGGEQIGSLVALSATNEVLFRIAVEPATGGGYQFTLEALQDGGGVIQTPPGSEIPLPDGWNLVEVEWKAGAGDGHLRVGLNGGSLAGLDTLDNAAGAIETIRWGGVDGALFTSAGSFDLDTYSSTR